MYERLLGRMYQPPVHALNGFAVHLLFAVRAVSRQHLAPGIGQQRKRQLLRVVELRQLFRLVGGDADAFLFTGRWDPSRLF